MEGPRSSDEEELFGKEGGRGNSKHRSGKTRVGLRGRHKERWRKEATRMRSTAMGEDR